MGPKVEFDTQSKAGGTRGANPFTLDTVQAQVTNFISKDIANANNWPNPAWPDGIGIDLDTAAYEAPPPDKTGGQQYYVEDTGEGNSLLVYNYNAKSKKGELIAEGYYDTDPQSGNVLPGSIRWLNPDGVRSIDNQVLAMQVLGKLDQQPQADTTQWKGDAAAAVTGGDAGRTCFNLRFENHNYNVIRYDNSKGQNGSAAYIQMMIYDADNGAFFDSFDAMAQPKYDPNQTGPTKEPVRTQESTTRTLAMLKRVREGKKGQTEGAAKHGAQLKLHHAHAPADLKTQARPRF